MRNVLAVFGAIFIFIWIGLVFFGDGVSEGKAVKDNIAIIQASEVSDDPAIQAQADVARTELKVIQTKQLAKAEKEKQAHQEKANPVPPAELSPILLLMLKIGGWTFGAGMIFLMIAITGRALKTD